MHLGPGTRWKSKTLKQGLEKEIILEGNFPDAVSTGPFLGRLALDACRSSARVEPGLDARFCNSCHGMRKGQSTGAAIRYFPSPSARETRAPVFPCTYSVVTA